MLPMDRDPTAHRRRLPRLGQELTGVQQGYGSTARLGGEEEVLDGGDADRRRLLDSTTVHQQQLQRCSETPGTWRRTLAEFG
jgi:hypothetical protein